MASCQYLLIPSRTGGGKVTSCLLALQGRSQLENKYGGGGGWVGGGGGGDGLGGGWVGGGLGFYV